MKHELKIWTCYFERVLDGTKTFEVRETYDRSFQKGDRVLLREFDPNYQLYDIETASYKKIGKFTGRESEFFIGYVLPIGENKAVFSLLKSMEIIP